MFLVLAILFVGLGLFWMMWQDQRVAQARTRALLEQLPEYQSKSWRLFKVYHIHVWKRVWIDSDNQTKKMAGLMILLMSLSVFSYFGMTLMALGVWILSGLGLYGLLIINQLYLKQRERNEKVQKMLPNLLMHMCCQASLSSDLSTILESTYVQSSEPIKTHFARILELLRIGYAADRAIEEASAEVNVPVFNDLCVILSLYAKYGGDLQQALQVFRIHIQNHMKVYRVLSQKTNEMMSVSFILHIVTLVMVGHAWLKQKELILMAFSDGVGVSLMQIVISLLLVYWLFSFIVFSWLRRL